MKGKLSIRKISLCFICCLTFILIYFETLSSTANEFSYKVTPLYVYN